MTDSRQRTSEFLAKHKIFANTIDMEVLVERFLSEMEKGLDGNEIGRASCRERV